MHAAVSSLLIALLYRGEHLKEILKICLTDVRCYMFRDIFRMLFQNLLRLYCSIAFTG